MGESSQRRPRQRSSGALKSRRVPLPWPEGQQLRILSIDGGGIRGVFSAALLAGLERTYLNGCSIARCFDLVVGTSTGGIVALGLGAGLKAEALQHLYVERGREVFPPCDEGLLGRVSEMWLDARRYFRYRYDRSALRAVLADTFGDLTLGESQNRLCVPSVEGRYGEAYIFKTPHHPDFKHDLTEQMAKVAMATSAAPTFFQPFRDKSYTFIDGGLFANDPIMVGLVDALTCYSLARDNIRILSIGCGSDRFEIDRRKMNGGMLAWRRVIDAAIRVQSLNAQGQASLLIGADQIVRLEPPPLDVTIELDDWRRAVSELLPLANHTLGLHGETVRDLFLSEFACPFTSEI